MVAVSTANVSSNRQVVLAWYDALRTGDTEAFQRVHHEDVIYDISGHSAISGRHEGLRTLVETILPVVFGGIDLAGFEFCKKVEIVAEDGARLVGIMEVDGKATNGKRYDQRYVHVFTVEDRKVVRVMEFFDTELARDTVLAGAEDIPPKGPFQIR